MTKRKRFSYRKPAEAGMTLIETMIALAVLFIVAAGLMGLAVVATVTTENQGHLATRTAEYAQDKMEQLMSLKYGDSSSDTISADCVMYLVDQDCSTGAAGLFPGGSLDFDAPADDYVDYLDREGNPLGGGVAAPGDWFFQRVWLIEDSVADVTLPDGIKRITVSCRTRNTVQMQSGDMLASTLVTLKSDPF
jgi:type II secretory pathway pseudopilin PulG